MPPRTLTGRTATPTTARRPVGVALAALLVASASAPAFAGPASGGDPARGRALFGSRNCNLCHKIDGRGGNLASPLDGVGRRLSADRMFRILRDPRSLNPEGHMPNPNLSEDEARHLAAYLATLR
ncbi:MAG TPA: c-type cytochrome [Thermodesulfobacteriota bacterium]